MYKIHHNCPVCHSKILKKIFKFKYNNSKIHLTKCNNCNIFFLNPIYFDENLYDDDYYYFNNYKFKYILEDRRKSELVYKYIQNKYPDINSIFDIGAASGIFLNNFKDKNFTVNGLETSSQGVELAKKRFNINLTKSSIEDYNEPINSQIITMTDVLEHTSNPLNILNKLYDISNDNSKIIIEVPNVNSFYFKIIGKKWVGFNKYHNYYFNNKNFSYLADKAKFKIIDCFTTNFNLFSEEGLWRIGIRDFIASKFKKNKIKNTQNTDTTLLLDKKESFLSKFKNNIKKIINFPANYIANNFLAGDQIWFVLKKKKPVKVLHLHTLPVISGSGINTFYTIDKINKKYFSSSLACKPNGELEDLVKSKGYNFYPIKCFTGPVNIFKDICALFQVYKLLKNNDFDIIHTHNSKAGFIGRLAGFLNGKVKIIHTVHGFAFHNKESFIKRNLFLILEKIAAYWTDYTIFISQPLIDWAKKYNLIKSPFKKIYSGIDIESFTVEISKTELKEKYGFNKNDFIIGEVAKLWEGKGHTTIIKAARILKNKIPDLKIIFVGDGYYKENLQKLVIKYNLQNIIFFMGFHNNKEVAELTKLMDIAMLISDFEGMGRVILEAMSVNTPVIATNVGGIPDLIQNNYNGLLIEPDNENQLADSILKLYNNPNLIKKIINNANLKFSEKYSIDTMINKINNIYNQF